MISMTRLFSLVTGLLFLGSLWLGYFFDLHYQQQRIMCALEQSKHLQREFTSLTQIAQTNEIQRTALTATEKKFFQFRQLLFSASDISSEINTITQLGQANNLQFTTVKLQPALAHDFYTEMPVQVGLIGTYQQLSNFFTATQSRDKIINWGDFTLSRQHPVVTTVNGNDNNADILLMNITLHLFYSNEIGL